MPGLINGLCSKAGKIFQAMFAIYSMIGNLLITNDSIEIKSTG